MWKLLKNSLFIVLFILMVHICNGQINPVSSKFTILKGQVKSELETITDCSVSLLFAKSKGDTVIAQVKLTDSTGQFAFEVMGNGTYVVHFQHVNYMPVRSEPIQIDSSQKEIVIPVTVLISLKKTLQGVVVKSIKPLLEHKVDRLVFNVSNSTFFQGGDALEALAKVPGINLSSGISLVGKSSVRLMVDNKFLPFKGNDLLTYLKTLPADNIARIEIITNPPAKYEAEGNSGIIAIITKKNKQDGYNGNIRAGFSQAYYVKGDLNGTINYRKNKWNLFGNVYNGRGNSHPVEKLTNIYPYQEWHQVSTRKDRSDYTSYQAGADYQINKKSIIGIIYYGYTNLPTINEYNEVKVFQPQKFLPDSILVTQNTFGTNLHSNSVNLNFATKIDSTGKKLDINVDYLGFNKVQRQFATSNSYWTDGTQMRETLYNQSRADLKVDVASAKVDFEWPLSWASLTFGGKWSSVSTNSGYLYENRVGGVFQKDTGKSNEFTYKENTEALYGSIDKQIGKWEVQLGLRGEYTQTNGFSITTQKKTNRNYFQLFPTAYVQYVRNDKNVFSLSYGRRINRPGFSDLNPFRFYFNPYRYTEGNPFLQPSYNNNIEFSYTYKNKYYLSLYWQNETDYYDQVPFVNVSSNEFYFFMTNIGRSNSYGMNLSVPVQITKWWSNNLQLNMYAYAFKSDYFIERNIESRFTTYLSSYNQFKISSKKKISADCSFSYFFPRREGVNQIGNTINLNGGLRWTSQNNKFAFGVAAGDILFKSVPKVTINGDGFSSISDNRYDTRNIRLTITYRFGSNMVKAKRQRSIGIEDEKGRIK